MTRKRITSVIFAIMLAALLCAVLSACDHSLANETPSRLDEPVPTAFIAYDINPSVEFVVDQYGTVVSAAGENEDARLLLWSESGIVGTKLPVATARILELSSEYGFLPENDAAIGVTIYGDNDGKFGKQINDSIKQFSGNIDAVFDRNLELDALGGDDIQKITARLSKYDAFADLDYIADLQSAQLFEKIKQIQSDAQNKLGAVYNIAISEAKSAYSTALQGIDDALILNYTLIKAGQNFFDFTEYMGKSLHAGLYMLSHSAELALEHYLELATEYLKDPVITRDDLKAIYDNLSAWLKCGFEDFAARFDDIDELALSKVTAYLNRVYLKLEERECADFVHAYKDSMAALKPSIESLADRYDLNKRIWDSTEKVCDYLNNDMHTAIGLLFGKLDELGLTALDLSDMHNVQAAIVRVRAFKENEYSRLNLSADDLAEIEDMKQTVSDAFEKVKLAYERAAAEARKNAADFYEQAKAALTRR